MNGQMIGIIAGTGLGDVLSEQMTDVQSFDVETPFGRPSAEIVTGNLAGRAVAFLNRHGNGHKLPPSKVPYAANIFALKKLGVRSVIASCATGSLTENFTPGDLIIVDQFIDKTFRRQNSFFDDYGAVHCELAQPVCGRLSDIIAAAADGIDVTTHYGGTYVCMEGPQFSTRAESLMHKQWGGELIGMTAMPEAKLAREAQLCYSLIALVSDYDCWKPRKKTSEKQTLLKEIIANLQLATDNCIKLIKAVLATDAEIISPGCPCRKSLELAVLTNPAQIDSAHKKELSILFE